MPKKLFSRNIHQPPLLLIAQIYLRVPKLANSELLLCFIQDPRQLQQVMLMQHTVEVITRATPRKMKKRVAVVSPEIENQYMFLISAVVGTCLRSVLKSSYFQSNLRND